MNNEIQKMEKCDICKKIIETHMSQFFNFAKEFLTGDDFTKAAKALLPFDGDVHGCLHLYGNDRIVKDMGTTLMRMDLEPAIYSFGVILELAESEFGKGGTTATYISACKTLDEIKSWIETEDFKSQAAEAFDNIVNEYFFSRV